MTARLTSEQLAEYRSLNLADLMSPDAAAVVARMRDNLLAELAWLRCELAEAGGPAETRVREWGVQVASHVARHASREAADADIAGLRAYGESPRLVRRTVSYTAWTEAAS